MVDPRVIQFDGGGTGPREGVVTGPIAISFGEREKTESVS